MAGTVRAEIVRPSGARESTIRVQPHQKPRGQRMRLSSRLTKLETAQRGQDGVFVVSGYSHEEHQRQIDELITSGKAAPDSLFVCIKKFPYNDHSNLKPDEREG
jgi:hypothetical protein